MGQIKRATSDELWQKILLSGLRFWSTVYPQHREEMAEIIRFASTAAQRHTISYT